MNEQINITAKDYDTAMCTDGFMFATDNCREFVDKVSDYEKLDSYKRVSVSDITTFPLQDEEELVDHFLDGNTGFEPALSDTIKGKTQLKIKFKDSDDNEYMYPLRDTAVKSLLDRAKISGASLSRMSKTQLATVLNMCYCLYKSSNALVYINNHKVSAVLSGDSKDFSVLPLNSLLDKLHNKFDELSFQFKFLHGYLDHSYIIASYAITDGDLLDTYKQAMNEHNISFNPNKLNAVVRFISSNVGLSTAKVSCYIRNGENFICLGTACSTPHRSAHTVDDFADSLNGMFAGYREKLSCLEKLMDIQLKYPIDVMTKICQKFKLPKQESIDAISLFESYTGTNSSTAYDVYMALQEVIYNCKVNKFLETKTLIYSEDLSKAVMFSADAWKSLDKPLKVSW